jgi:hypothetical protein
MLETMMTVLTNRYGNNIILKMWTALDPRFKLDRIDIGHTSIDLELFKATLKYEYISTWQYCRRQYIIIWYLFGAYVNISSPTDTQTLAHIIAVIFVFIFVLIIFCVVSYIISYRRVICCHRLTVARNLTRPPQFLSLSARRRELSVARLRTFFLFYGICYGHELPVLFLLYFYYNIFVCANRHYYYYCIFIIIFLCALIAGSFLFIHIYVCANRHWILWILLYHYCVCANRHYYYYCIFYLYYILRYRF